MLSFHKHAIFTILKSNDQLIDQGKSAIFIIKLEYDVALVGA